MIYFVFNIIVVLVLAFLTSMTSRYNRSDVFVMTAWIGITVSFWLWVIFAAIHFITKWW